MEFYQITKIPFSHNLVNNLKEIWDFLDAKRLHILHKKFPK